MATGRATVGAELIAAALETRRDELTSASLEETKGRIEGPRTSPPGEARLTDGSRLMFENLGDATCEQSGSELRVDVELPGPRLRELLRAPAAGILEVGA